MRRIFWSVGLLAAAALGVGYWWGSRGSAEPGTAAILSQVQRLNRLVTVKYTVQKVVGLREPKQPFGEESILLILQAHVEAGVNLDGLRAGDVIKRADEAVVLRMPPPEILNIAVDEGETKVWDRDKTWWTPWVPYSPDLEKQARQKGLDAVREAALGMGILNEAERNAHLSIRSLLSLAGIRNVVFVPGKTS